MPPDRLCLLIADISGYTEYLSGVEIDHAQDILADLIGTVVTALRPGFRLAKLEGDAAFCFAPTEKVDGSMLLDTIERCYFGFRRRRRDVRQATSCGCNACVRIPDLNLKFVAHHGVAIRQRVAGHDELLGSDVIVVHRLLKNDIVQRLGIGAYLALTAPLVAEMAIDPAAMGMIAHTETYEHLGAVNLWVHDLERRWHAEDARLRHRVEAADALYEVEFHSVAPPQTVWEFITTPGRRMEWQGPGGVTSVDEIVKPAGRRGAGAVSHCMHGAGAQVEEILDWRPFDYVTIRSTWPPAMGGLQMTQMYELEPTASGTTLRFRIARPRRVRDRQVLEQMGPAMAEQFGKGVGLMLDALAAESAAHAAGPREPALPTRRAQNGFLAAIPPIEYAAES